MKAEPMIVVEHRKELSYLLCQAAEIEHLAMCQYLYAAFSLRTEPGPGLTAEQLPAVERWRKVILAIAGEEMLHWALVNNLITAIGSAPFVSRPDLPHRAKGYPPDVQFALLPFGETALRHFIYFERPVDADVADPTEFVPAGGRPAAMEPTELLPRGQDFLTQGQLYRSLEGGLRHLAQKLGEPGLFIGPPWAQATPRDFHWPDLVAITDLDAALQVVERIVVQGEGAAADATDAHFGRFRAVLDELLAVKAADPTFEPAHPVTAAVVRGYEGAEPEGPRITDPTTAGVSDLFNAIYDLLLQMLCRYFAFGHETGEQLTMLASAAVGLMFTAVKPLGMLLARLPVGEEAPGATAGASFQLAYRASFLLPHRRVAWIRFVERLEETAAHAGSIAAGGADRVVLDRVALALRATAERLAAEIEPA
ncbi:MAG TPA: ferritin-like domain-containing protein [Acidimicrobiales bacterium]|nr:ferritin-like domain-containing protein [Acidimicrobiales bacterium]